MAVVEAGELKRTVVIKTPTTTRNSEGGKEISYADWITAKAKITRNSQYRTTEGEAAALLNTDTVWIRYSAERAAISKDHVLTYYGIDHLIHEIEYIGTERNRFIKILCKGK